MPARLLNPRAAFLGDDLSIDTGTFEILDFLRLENFEQWKDTITKYQEEADIIAVLNFHQLQNAGGDIVKPAEVIDWMVAQNSLPELGLVAAIGPETAFWSLWAIRDSRQGRTPASRARKF